MEKMPKRIKNIATWPIFQDLATSVIYKAERIESTRNNNFAQTDEHAHKKTIVCYRIEDF